MHYSKSDPDTRSVNNEPEAEPSVVSSSSRNALQHDSERIGVPTLDNWLSRVELVGAERDLDPDLQLLHLFATRREMQRAVYIDYKLSSDMLGYPGDGRCASMVVLARILYDMDVRATGDIGDVLRQLAVCFPAYQHMAEDISGLWYVVTLSVTTDMANLGTLAETVRARYHKYRRELDAQIAGPTRGKRNSPLKTRTKLRRSARRKRKRDIDDADGDNKSQEYRELYPDHYLPGRYVHVRALATAYLLDGTRNGQVDDAVARAMLFGSCDFDAVANSKMYYKLTLSVTYVARAIRMSRNTVKESLDRLQAAGRIFIPRQPTRGRNRMCVLIGVRDGTAFAAVLTPRALWNLTMHRLHGATSDDARQDCIQWLEQHYARLDGDDRVEMAEVLTVLRARYEDCDGCGG